MKIMGLKERAFAPKVSVSLEELVPQDHFYQHLQKVLDLSFVQEDRVSFSRSFIVEPSTRDINENARDGFLCRHRRVLPHKVVSPSKQKRLARILPYSITSK